MVELEEKNFPINEGCGKLTSPPSFSGTRMVRGIDASKTTTTNIPRPMRINLRIVFIFAGGNGDGLKVGRPLKKGSFLG